RDGCLWLAAFVVALQGVFIAMAELFEFPDWASNVSSAICFLPQIVRPRPVITRIPLVPPLIWSVNLDTAASGIVGEVGESFPPDTEVCARRSRAIWPRKGISRLGSVRIRWPLAPNRMPCTRYTGPDKGWDSSGVTAVARPTIVDAGHPTVPPCTAWAVS